MTDRDRENRDIIRRRLENQQLTESRYTNAGDLVRWMGAVQAQDYAGAKWALGLRLQSVDDDIERAFAAGEILRTHVMRPTWHFVAPCDIRWMMELTGARVHAKVASIYRQFELDDATFGKSRRVIERALRGGKQLTKAELGQFLTNAGIEAGGARGGWLLFAAEIEGLVCSGARRGAQQTYTLLEERVPPAPRRTREEALAELTLRYFTSHGPAQANDLAWWSGLTVGNVREGIALLGGKLTVARHNDKTYYSSTQADAPRRHRESVAYLLPNYDEYGIAYRDRSAFIGEAGSRFMLERRYPHFFIVDGHVRGVWRRGASRRSVIVNVRPFVELDDAALMALGVAGRRYGTFLGMHVEVQIDP